MYTAVYCLEVALLLESVSGKVVGSVLAPEQPVGMWTAGPVAAVVFVVLPELINYLQFVQAGASSQCHRASSG